MPDDRMRLLDIREISVAEYWREIALKLAQCDETEKHAVIFVHGYNVSFEAAALRAAQMGFDLSVKGAMAFFSWPSRGAMGDYIVDSTTIEASEQAMTDFWSNLQIEAAQRPST